MKYKKNTQTLWLEYVLDRVPTPLFFIDPAKNQVKFSNAAAKKMLGLSAEGTLADERYGQKILAYDKNGNLLSTEQIPSARASRGEILQGEEVTLVTSQGQFHIVAESETVGPIYGEDKTVLLMLKDVTYLKKAEAEVKKSQEQLAMALAVSKVGFYSWDIVSSMVTLSDQAKLDWGFTARTGAIPREELLSVIHPDDQDAVAAATTRTLEQGENFDLEFRVVPQNSEEIWLEVKGQLVYDVDKKPLSLFGTSVNITERKMRNIYLQRKNEELALAKTAAEVANAAKSAFLANMSHEIRTPLGAIMGFVDVMRDPHLSRKELDEYLAIIVRNSDQLLMIIDDILDLAKVEAGKMLIDKVSFSLPTLISDFTSLMALKAEDKGIGFHVRASSTIPEVVWADPTRIKQILHNAVGNAIKFTEQGYVELIVNYREPKLEFTVKDTGRGISSDQADHLFQPFAQADASTTRKFGGTGLGLVLTRKICQLMIGDFTLVESQLTKGSTFRATMTIEVPEKSRQMASSEVRYSLGAPPTLQGSLDGLHVLVVEDSPDNQVLLRILIEKTGAKLEIAEDGRQGVEAVLTNRFDLVFMDIQMPQLDGHSAVRLLREKGYRGTIIALTAHAMKEERDRCLRSGFDDFLTKPIQKDMLYNLLADSYRRR